MRDAQINPRKLIDIVGCSQKDLIIGLKNQKVLFNGEIHACRIRKIMQNFGNPVGVVYLSAPRIGFNVIWSESHQAWIPRSEKEIKKNKH